MSGKPVGPGRRIGIFGDPAAPAGPGTRPADTSAPGVPGRADLDPPRPPSGVLHHEIELLSLANKTRGKTGRGLYRGKQRELAAAGVNLVEIDLLRGGIHSTSVALTDLRGRAGPFDYHVCVTWVEREDASFVAPIVLAEPLPTIPVPLTPGVPPPAIDLQAVMTQVYDGADYGRIVDYRTPCDPPLSADQQAWAEGLLRAKGLVK